MSAAFIFCVLSEKKNLVLVPYNMAQGLSHAKCCGEIVRVFFLVVCPCIVCQCSAECGGGHKSRYVVCTTEGSSSVLSDEACNTVTKPRSSRTCNNMPCGPVWLTSEWSQVKVIRCFGLTNHNQFLFERYTLYNQFEASLIWKSIQGVAETCSILTPTYHGRLSVGLHWSQ